MKTPALLLLTCVVSLFVFPSAAQSQSLFSEDYCKQKVSDASSLESCERRFRWRAYRKQKQRAEGLWRRRYQQPVDRDFALRQQNVTDVEILQIENQIRSVIPGAIVNIGSIWSGCECGEAADCKNQVWVVASVPGESTGLMLSQFGDLWAIGQLQQWFLDRDNLKEKFDAVERQRAYATGAELIELNERLDALQEHKWLLAERYPGCNW